jgi:phage gp36-like protein
MAYVTQQQLIDRFGEAELIQLTDRENTGAIDAVVLAQAIGDAGAEIDGYLASRYQLPIAPPPAILTLYAGDIVRYRLYDDGATEEVRKSYDDAIKFVRLVGEGKLRLGAAADEPVASGGAQMESGGRVFGRDQGGFLS